MAVVLLVIALLAVLSHVCVRPGHVHATPVHGDHEPLAADASDSGDAVHAASCEAVRAPVARVTPPAVICRADAVVAVAVASAPPPLSVPHPAATSPPLFLLHAALLI